MTLTRPAAGPSLETTSPVGVFSLADAIDPRVDRLWSIDDVATYLNVSRRGVERLKSAGRLPQPIVVIGRLPRWQSEDIRRWAEGGGRP
jgi:excisionase family DNA binding protein